MPLTRWSPSTGLFNLKDDVDRVMGDFLTSSWGDPHSRLSPPLNIEETENEYVVTAEVPGMKREEVQITFQDSTLSIVGEKKAEKEFKEANFHRFERQFGSFSRSFSLPRGIVADKIDAAFKDGILTIRLPKVEEVKPKKIEVRVI